MTLKLLLSLFFVVWYVTSAETYKSPWVVSHSDETPTICAHDGFLNTSSTSQCSCTADYTGSLCTVRKCRNYGLDTNKTDGFVNNQCICPPGFLGRNCEPVRCVNGENNIFQQKPQEKAISVVITYNKFMEESLGNSGSDITKLICDYTQNYRMFNLLGVSMNIPITTNSTNCVTDITRAKELAYDSCEPDIANFDVGKSSCIPLQLKWITSTVENSPPNSIVFIATNVNVSDIDESVSRKIIATAIAKKIQIHVIVYYNPLIPNVFTDAGFLFLQNIASSTLGNYVLNDIAGDGNQHEITKWMIDSWTNDIGIAAVSNGIRLPFSSEEVVYVTAQLDLSTSIFINGVIPKLVTGTDFWKLYEIPADQSAPFLQITGQKNATFAYIYTKDRLKAYSAFTSDADNVLVDAAYPTIVVGGSYSLVVHVEYGDTVLNRDGVRYMLTIQSENGLTYNSVDKNRNSCQFNLQLNSATCAKSGTAIQIIGNTNYKYAAFPIYCSEFNDANDVYNILIEDLYEMDVDTFQQTISQVHSKSFTKFTMKCQKHLERIHLLAREYRNSKNFLGKEENTDVTDIACGLESINVESFGKRSFVIVSELWKDEQNTTISPVDNIFLNENSIVYQLSNYMSTTVQNQYSSFRSLFYEVSEGGMTTETVIQDDYKKFLTKVMNKISNANTPGVHTNGSVDISSLLVSSLTGVNMYSDVLIVLTSPLTLGNEQENVYKLIETMRSRLFIVLLPSYANFTSDEYSLVNDFAVRSGGVAFTLNSFDELRQFNDQYFPLLIDNDVVAKGYAENIRPGILISSINLQNKTYTLLITNRNSDDSGPVDVLVTVYDDKGNNAAVSPLSSFGELRLFSVKVDTEGTYSVRVAMTGLAKLINVLLLEDVNNEEYISLSFINKNGAMSNSISFNDGGYLPVLHSSIPLTNYSKLTITENVALEPFKVVFSGYLTNNAYCEGYKNFNNYVNFQWVCSSSDGLFHVQVDAVYANGASNTRTYPFTCVGVATNSVCLNGGTADDNNHCLCEAGWSGSVCQTPVCQNGGTVTSGNTCHCDEDYQGDFCEISNNYCSNSSSIKVDYRTDLSSLIIVADVNSVNISGSLDGIQLPGIPITVIIHGDDVGSRVVLTTTDGNLLPDVFKKYSNLNTTTSNSLYDALTLALSSQVTDRALILLLTSKPEIPINSTSLNQLAAQRTEIRVLVTSDADIGPNTIKLAFVGNGIPISLSTDGFKTYLTEYVSPLFNRLDSQLVFNVFASDSINSTTNVIVSTDGKPDNEYFIHLFNAELEGCSNVQRISPNSTFCYVKDRDTEPSRTFTITANSSNAFYSVERLNYLKTSYGFNFDVKSTNETLNTGVSYNSANVISIYSVPSSNSAFSTLQLPYLKIREISDDPKEYVSTMMTKKSDSCVYQYFAVLQLCQNETTGYQVQLVTRSSDSQQFTLVCFNTKKPDGSTNCGGTESPVVTTEPQKCQCDPGFNGIQCTEPTCVNGIRDGTVCRCKMPFYGSHCEKEWFDVNTPTPTTPATTPTPEPVRAFAFILDIVGEDDYAYNQTVEALIEYTKAFNASEQYIFFTFNVEDTASFDFQTYNSISDLQDRLDLLYSLRETNTKTQNLASALSRVRDSFVKIPQLKSVLSSNVFYLTQVGLLASDDPTTVTGLEQFSNSSLVFSPFGKSADPSVLETLKKFSPDVKNVNDYYNAVRFMIDQTNANSDVSQPTNPNRSCAYGLQANIILGIDRSKAAPGTNDKLYHFLYYLRASLNYIDNDENRCANPSLPSFYNERTVLSAMVYYNNLIKRSYSCPSNYPVAMNSTLDGDTESPTYDVRQVTNMGKYVNDDTCICNRFHNASTAKIVIWLPRAKCVNSTDSYSELLKLKTDNAAHFVVPFYDIEPDKANDLFYRIVTNNNNINFEPDFYVLPNAATGDINDILKQLLSKLCEFGGIDPTAVPPAANYYDGLRENYREF